MVKDAVFSSLIANSDALLPAQGETQGQIMQYFLRITLILFAGLFLVACNTAANTVQETGFHVAKVDVRLPVQSENKKLGRYTEGFQSTLENTISHYAREYNSTHPNAKNAYSLRVDVDTVYFINPVLAVAVNDANKLYGKMTVTDMRDGRVILSRKFVSSDQRSIALGIVLGPGAALVKKDVKEYHMARGLSYLLMNRIFPKTKLADSAKKRLRGKQISMTRATMSPLSQPVSPPSTAVSAPTEPTGDEVVAAGS